MQQVNNNGNFFKALLFNLAQQGQISPQAMGQVMQFMQAMAAFRQQQGGGQQPGGFPAGGTNLAGGHACGLNPGGVPAAGINTGGLQRPVANPGQRDAIRQLRGLLGNNFNPFVRNLMQGGPNNINNMMRQLPAANGQANGLLPQAPGQLPGLPGQGGVNQAGQQIANPRNRGGIQYNIINNGGTVNVQGGNAPTLNGGQPKNLEQLDQKWLAKHGKGNYKACGKNEFGKMFELNSGKYKGHKAVPYAPGKYNVVSPEGQPVAQWNAPKGAKDKVASPLTFDVNGDGKISTTGKGGKKIDLDGDGKVDNAAWAGKGDGVLKFGKGDSGKSLLGNNTDVAAAGKMAADKFRASGNEQKAQEIEGRLKSGQFNGKPANGFDALKQISALINPESVADGKLDKNELGVLEQTIGLRMEVDGQDRTLQDSNVAGVNLAYKDGGAGANKDENGNEHRQVGAGFIRNDGQIGKVNDVWFQM